MSPDILQILKELLDQESISSNWDAGRELEAYLADRRIAIGSSFGKTEEVRQLAEKLGRSEKKLFQCMQIKDNWTRDDAVLADQHKLSLGRAIDLLPAKEFIRDETDPDNLKSLNDEFWNIVRTNPGPARAGVAKKDWDRRFATFLEKCSPKDSAAQRTKLRKVKKEAANPTSAARSALLLINKDLH